MGGIAVEVLSHRDPAVAAQIAEVQRLAYQVEAEIVGFAGIPPLYDTPEDVQALDLTILGIVEDDQLVALLGYSRSCAAVEIDRLAVHPAHFRRGHARRLIEHLHAREADAARFEVSTGRDNTPAVTLYTSMGYRRHRDVPLPEGIAITIFIRES